MGTHPIFESDFDCLTELFKMALSDQQVSKQIEHMIQFIKNESAEKVDEIHAKADEEFQIEKGRLVNQQRVKIIDFYTKKEKQLEQQKRLQQSKFINEGRLKILKSREEHINAVNDKAKEQLAQLSKNEAEYGKMLSNLWIQACYVLLENDILINCREQDVKLIQSVADFVVTTYKKATNSDLKYEINQKGFLPSDSAGGLSISNKSGSIIIENTLEARLSMLSTKSLPSMRNELFGANPNRKFLD